MITLIIFISIFVAYVASLFIRGIYHEKKDRKLKDPFKDEDTKPI